MLASTRARVTSEMARLPLSTYDTVLAATAEWPGDVGDGDLAGPR